MLARSSTALLRRRRLFYNDTINMPVANDLWIMTLTKINLNKGNRMLRIGVGQNGSKWFMRIDLWFLGIRIS
jgi:hypothetical protein